MTGLDGRRVYLDWNATAPLRPEARAAMLEAMDAVGNPSSVHTEGRAARAIVERARAQLADLLWRAPSEIVFTSGATEGAAAVIRSGWPRVMCAETEHDCIYEPARRTDTYTALSVDADGLVDVEGLEAGGVDDGDLICVQSANSETGVEQRVAAVGMLRLDHGCAVLSDMTQSVGKIEGCDLEQPPGADFTLCSAHKLGGPKGVGATVIRAGADFEAEMPGGGQETGRRSGTENVVGIAGFGAAAEAAQRDLEDGVWDRVAALRNILEARLEAVAPDLIFVGREAERLPNTTCIALPGWKGETQVMQLDLAGFAVSAGSACSSGKVKESRVLRAMGFDAVTASSAIRVSLGPTTTEAEITAFAEAWTTLYRKRTSRAA
ncbi:MAG: cysteine desulfurase family protein [Pseudomonadota bacterium]